MFGLFKKKDPIKKLEQEYEALLVKARDTQRSGDIKAYALLVDKAEALADKIEQMRNKES